MKINEFDKQVTQADIDELEKFADKIFAKVGIDVNFTRHFLDRVNDERNGKPISMSELTRLFKQEQKRWGKKIAQLGPDEEAVMKDLQTDINLPFALRWDDKNNELDLIAKTVMRKKNFRTPNPEFPVENVNEERGNPFNGLPDFTINNHIKKLTDRLKEIHKEIQGKPKADIEEFRDELYKINYKMKQLKSAKPLSSVKMNEDFGSVPPLAELILMAVVAKTSVDVLIGMFKVALKTGKGLKKLNDLRKRVSKMGQDVADYAMPYESIDEATRDELLAKLKDDQNSKFMKAALEAMHRLVTSKGSKQSIGGYAFDIARAFNGVNAKELEKMYHAKFSESIIHEDTLTELNILRKKNDGVKQSNPLVVLDKLSDRNDDKPFPIKFYDGETIEVTPKMARRFMNKYYDDLEPEQRDIVDRYITTKNGFIQAVKKLQFAEGN